MFRAFCNGFGRLKIRLTTFIPLLPSSSLRIQLLLRSESWTLTGIRSMNKLFVQSSSTWSKWSSYLMNPNQAALVSMNSVILNRSRYWIKFSNRVTFSSMHSKMVQSAETNNISNTFSLKFLYILFYISIDTSEIAEVEEGMSSMTERWLLVEELLKQKNAQQQVVIQQQLLVQDHENSIDTVLSNPVPLSLQEEKNDETLNKLRVSSVDYAQ